MQFLRQDVLSLDEAKDVGMFDVGFYGDDSIDDRSRHSAELTRGASRRAYKVKYDPVRFTLTVGDTVVLVHSLEDLFRDIRAQSIVLDATTLEFPEILYILKAYRMQSRRPRSAFFYVEPEGYKPRGSSESLVPGNAFDLSSGFQAKKPLPIFSRMLSDSHRAHLVAFMGFEGDRLMRVLDDDDGHFYQKVSVVFGIPPFQPNWDLHALMANSSLLERQNVDVYCCGANNPYAAYKLLADAHAGIGSGSTNRLSVAPFGTKPMALGAALYCLGHDILTPIFDHPLKKADRTYGVHRRHWYEVDMTN